MSMKPTYSHNNSDAIGTLNYDIVTRTSDMLNKIKGYEVGYTNPRKGRMIVNFRGENFLIDISHLSVNIGENTLDNAMKEYNYLFD